MRKIGEFGENLAVNFLEKNGYKVETRNYHYLRVGEIDIVCISPEGKNVFIEVKYRKTNNFGGGEGAITSNKKRKIYETIQNYCLENNIDEENIRFDVIVICENEKKLTHYKNISFEE